MMRNEIRMFKSDTNGHHFLLGEHLSAGTTLRAAIVTTVVESGALAYGALL